MGVAVEAEAVGLVVEVVEELGFQRQSWLIWAEA